MRNPWSFAILVFLVPVFTAPITGAQAGAEQVHLGLDDTSPSASHVVSWYQASPSPEPTVTVTGPDGERTVAAEQVPGPAAGFVYEATLDGLEPDTGYSYAVDSRTFGFTTPPDRLADNGSFRLVALGDMGITSEAQATVDTVGELAPDLVLHMGDLSYGEGDQTTWNTWFNMLEPVAANAPWLPALGNHETLPPVTEVAYVEQRFSLPNNERWYSFDWAGVHIVALDTYSETGYPYTGDELGFPEEELTWLEQDLEEHANATWTIVFLHEAPYSSNRHGPSDRVQEAFEPLFQAHGVDLVLAGHDHGYERTFPLIDGAPQSSDPDTYAQGEGVVYVVSGAAGQSLYTGWTNDPPDWSVARESLFHVFELTVTPDELSGRVVPTVGDDFQDSFTIRKQAAGSTGEDAAPGQGPSATPFLPAVLVLVAVLAGATRRRP